MTMKTLLFGFILSVLVCQQSKSQELFGRYSNYMESLDFKTNGIVDFKLNTRGGISHEYNGTGNYQIKDGFLKITLTKVPAPYSEMKSLNNLLSPDSVTIYVFDALTNKPFDDLLNVLLVRDEKIIAHKLLRNGFVRFPIKECLSGVKIEIRYVGYPRFTQRLISDAKTDFRIDFSEFPGPEETQRFLNDEGDGLAIAINGDVLLMRKNNNSVAIPNMERPKYNWIEFKKEK